MTKKDIAELKRRLKKEECTFTKMCGCYVDAQKNIKLRMNKTFLNLTDEEFYKYLEIAKKVLSGTVGNQLLELSFLREEGALEKQRFMLGLRDSELKNEELLEHLYELIIENYEYAGNYLILIFHDTYDIISKTTDNVKLDESTEVYQYFICAICPVELSKAGLGYREDENKIGVRLRDWIVSPPETGFVFPAFTDRSSDIHSLIYYTKNVKEPQPEFMESALGCAPMRTATQEKTIFQSILQNVAAENEYEADEVFMNAQQTMNTLVEEHKSVLEKAPVLLNNDAIQSILAESDIPLEAAKKIEEFCQEEFGETQPLLENLIDSKALKLNMQKKKEQDLQKEVLHLKQELDEAKTKIDRETVLPTEREEGDITELEYDIILKVKPQKVAEIRTQVLDGKKCIIIPLEEEEQAVINGSDSAI